MKKFFLPVLFMTMLHAPLRAAAVPVFSSPPPKDVVLIIREHGEAWSRLNTVDKHRLEAVAVRMEEGPPYSTKDTVVYGLARRLVDVLQIIGVEQETLHSISDLPHESENITKMQLAAVANMFLMQALDARVAYLLSSNRHTYQDNSQLKKAGNCIECAKVFLLSNNLVNAKSLLIQIREEATRDSGLSGPIGGHIGVRSGEFTRRLAQTVSRRAIAVGLDINVRTVHHQLRRRHGRAQTIAS